MTRKQKRDKFSPNYTITPRLLKNIKRIAVIIAGLNQVKYPKPVLRSLEAEARTISSHSSTRIEGNPLPLTEVRRLLKAHPQNLRDSEKEVLNYNQTLLTLNDKITKAQISFDLKLILSIHKTLMPGLLPKFSTGKTRKEAVFVNDPRSGKTIFWPPDQQDVLLRLTSLIEYVNSNFDQIDPVILSGIFHKQFVLIHPFIDGNGRTARLATKTLLARMGLDTFNLFSFENYYNRNITKYFASVGALGDFYDIEKHMDFTPWLEYFSDGIIDELLRVGEELKAATPSQTRRIKEHHKILLNFIKKHGQITDGEYKQLTHRSKSSRNLDFRFLQGQNLITKHDKGPATYYCLAK